MKGLVLGPLHSVQPDTPDALFLDQIDPTQGRKEDLTAVLEKAHKKGRSLPEIRYSGVEIKTSNMLGSFSVSSEKVVSSVCEVLLCF